MLLAKSILFFTTLIVSSLLLVEFISENSISSLLNFRFVLTSIIFGILGGWLFTKLKKQSS